MKTRTVEDPGAEVAQSPSGEEALRVALTRQEAVAFQRRTQAVDGLLGQAEFAIYLGRRHGPVALPDNLEDEQRPEVGRNAVVFVHGTDFRCIGPESL